MKEILNQYFELIHAKEKLDKLSKDVEVKLLVLNKEIQKEIYFAFLEFFSSEEIDDIIKNKEFIDLVELIKRMESAPSLKDFLDKN